MGLVIVAIYLILVGAIGLFGISIDPKIVSLLALIAGVLLLVSGWSGMSWPTLKKE